MARADTKSFLKFSRKTFPVVRPRVIFLIARPRDLDRGMLSTEGTDGFLLLFSEHTKVENPRYNKPHKGFIP